VVGDKHKTPMSESTIRRIVHDAYEQEVAVNSDSGLYGDERIRAFFAEIKNLVNECFQSLYDVVQREYADPVERQQRLTKGLAYLAASENERMNVDEVTRATETYPAIADEYRRAMIRFAQCTGDKRRSGVKIRVPSFHSFLFDLYRRVANSMEVRTGRYFTTMSYLEQEIYLKDILRITMNASITMQRIEVEEEEEEEENQYERGGGASVGRGVLPSDSVSNIHVGGGGSSSRKHSGTGGSSRRAPSRAHSTASSTMLEGAMFAARDRSAVESSSSRRPEKSLTRLTLEEHKKSTASQRSGRNRRSFAPASIAASHTSRVIDTGDAVPETKKIPELDQFFDAGTTRGDYGGASDCDEEGGGDDWDE
jgi:hypothetical protein